ncbi:hypothetical protein GLOIN_2v1883854 [Rhizophagus clarus]|uniref:MULE transposase domain-containing protein n=1 Tax=Rhizophagus clarus TaxID=94130 RepID=A0A8H3QID4_9GLOM|nr:hypothetical protein GLOIN_2v1883854 [Rhizophagus clarus]
MLYTLETELPSYLKEILPCDYKYQLEKLNILPSLFTEEDIELKQKIQNNKAIKGKKVIFKEERHCIHSATVKVKQGSRVSKQENSNHSHNINCQAKMLMRIEKRKLLLYVNLENTHNHIPYSAESLSFRPVCKIIRDKYIKLFKNGHSPTTAIYTYEDNLHLAAADEKELISLLADRAINPDYNFVYNLFKKYREINLGLGSAVLHQYNKELGEICYFDASSSFDSLNTSVTLLYTSCAAGALPLGLFLTSGESKITIEFVINKLKSILPQNAFFGRGIDLGPSVFVTDDSAAERNAIELCWPKSGRFLCVFHVLQALWR